jgi:glycosyltransferase involved in cell wall biosynthesis
VFSHERKPFEKTLAQYFLNSCDGFLSMSKDVLGQVQQLQANKPSVYVPHPMYDMFGPVIEKAEAIQKLGLDPQFKYCLFFGFIRKYKGLHLLLESFAKLDRQALKLKLIVAGEFYEDANPYHQQIQDLDLKDDVILKSDFIPNNQVGLYFCASDIVVQTYITATQSGVTQIAYFYNTPMLVTNVGGLAELVPNNVVGMVCEKNSDEISKKIEQFFQNNSEIQMKLAIEKEKQKFTWPYLCSSLLQIAAKN